MYIRLEFWSRSIIFDTSTLQMLTNAQILTNTVTNANTYKYL